MARIILKGWRSPTWQGYLDPKDREMARKERWYKIGRSVDVCVRGDGRIDLFVADHGQSASTRLPPLAHKKLALLMKRARS